MNTNGRNQTRLTTHPDSDTHPTWSPDGTKIAFVSNRDGNSELYVMNVDEYGSRQTRLTIDPDSNRTPDWSSAASSSPPR